MYDVMNFGCIPVVLSDDLVWAYTKQTNGVIHHLNFSIHMPQQVIQYSTTTLLRKFKSKQSELGILPSGRLLYDVLEESYKQDPEFINGIYVNPLVKILLRIPPDDVLALQAGVRVSAPYFQYYAMNNSMRSIPTASHAFPTGGAIAMLAHSLSTRKRVGIENIRDGCLIEKTKAHKYDTRYPCNRANGKRYRRFL